MFHISKRRIAQLFKLLKKPKKTVENMQPKEALDFQKQSFMELASQEKNGCTPPYIIIASFLSAKDPQVAEAAKYYLKKIAAENPQLQNEINTLYNLNGK